MSILWVPFTAYLVTLDADCGLERPFQWKSYKVSSHYFSLVYQCLRWHFSVRQASSEIHLLLVPYWKNSWCMTPKFDILHQDLTSEVCQVYSSNYLLPKDVKTAKFEIWHTVGLFEVNTASPLIDKDYTLLRKIAY